MKMHSKCQKSEVPKSMEPTPKNDTHNSDENMARKLIISLASKRKSTTTTGRPHNGHPFVGPSYEHTYWPAMGKTTKAPLTTSAHTTSTSAQTTSTLAPTTSTSAPPTTSTTSELRKILFKSRSKNFFFQSHRSNNFNHRSNNFNDSCIHYDYFSNNVYNSNTPSESMH